MTRCVATRPIGPVCPPRDAIPPLTCGSAQSGAGDTPSRSPDDSASDPSRGLPSNRRSDRRVSAVTGAAAESLLLSRIFRLTLSRSQLPQLPEGTHFFAALAADLSAAHGDSEPTTLLLSIDHLDRLLIEVLSAATPVMPLSHFDYLVDCFRRCDEEAARLQPLPSATEALLRRARELIARYAGLVLAMPMAFPNQAAPGLGAAGLGVPQLSLRLQLAPTDAGGAHLPTGFLDELGRQLERNGLVDAVFGPLLLDLHRAQLDAGPALDGRFLAPLRALTTLLQSSLPADAAAVALPIWLPGGSVPRKAVSEDQSVASSATTATAADAAADGVPDSQLSGREFETDSLWGPFFSPSALPSDAPDFVQEQFGGTRVHLRADVDVKQLSIRTSARTLQQGLAQMVESILRRPAIRPHVMRWLATACLRSRRRVQEFADFTCHASDGFFVNLCAVLLRLAEPIADPVAPKWNSIDNAYFLHPLAIIDVADETRLVSGAAESSHWVDPRNLSRQRTFQSIAGSVRTTGDDTAAPSAAPASPPAVQTRVNFVTECFFLTQFALHIGLRPICRKMRDTQRKLVAVRRDLHDAPPNAALALNQQMELLVRNVIAFDAVMLDPAMLQATLNFYAFVAQWLLRLIDPDAKGLPLAETVPHVYAALPEFVLEAIVDYALFAAQFAPAALQPGFLLQLTPLLVTLLHATAYISNPYLRARLVELMYMLTPEVQNRDTRLMLLFEDHPLCKRFLLPGLLHFYIDVEITVCDACRGRPCACCGRLTHVSGWPAHRQGSHTQFFDKFSIRYHIAVIMKHLWRNPDHRRVLIESTRSRMFVQFAHLLMNDNTFLLEEAIDYLGKIHDIQALQKQHSAWAALSPVRAAPCIAVISAAGCCSRPNARTG